jgi:putative hemolysin
MLEGLIILMCLLLNGLLAGAEMAFVTVSRPALRELVRQGHTRAKLLLRLRENPERTLSVVQVGITLVGALAGAVGGAGAEELLSPSIETKFGVGENTADTIAIGLVVLPLTYLTVVIGELVPKSLALKNALNLALLTAPWLLLFDKIFGPVVTLLEWSTKRLLQLLMLFRIRRQRHEKVDAGHAEDATVLLEDLSLQHRQYVLNLVGLERKTVGDIGLPWQNVVAIQLNQSLREVEEIILSSGHTRLPVVQNSDVVGILNTKEFMSLRAAGLDNWQSLIRPALKLQASTPLLTALRLLQEQHIHMGIIYARSTLWGIVTLEDILEEIVGDIYDEDDDGRLRRILRSNLRTIGLGGIISSKS